jgi:hypothetical protein
VTQVLYRARDVVLKLLKILIAYQSGRWECKNCFSKNDRQSAYLSSASSLASWLAGCEENPILLY